MIDSNLGYIWCYFCWCRIWLTSDRAGVEDEVTVGDQQNKVPFRVDGGGSSRSSDDQINFSDQQNWSAQKREVTLELLRREESQEETYLEGPFL